MNLHLSDHRPHWIDHLYAQATTWAHAHHANTLRRREGIGAYAAAELGYPLAPEWPATPLPKYIQARAEGMQVAAVRRRDTAELAAIFNY